MWPAQFFDRVHKKILRSYPYPGTLITNEGNETNGPLNMRHRITATTYKRQNFKILK